MAQHAFEYGLQQNLALLQERLLVLVEPPGGRHLVLGPRGALGLEGPQQRLKVFEAPHHAPGHGATARETYEGNEQPQKMFFT